MFAFLKICGFPFFFICTPLWGMVSSRQFITCWNWILHLMSFVTSLSPNIKRLLLQLKRGHFSFFFLHKTFKKKYTSDYFWVTEMLFSIFFSWFVLALIPVRWVCIRDVWNALVFLPSFITQLASLVPIQTPKKWMHGSRWTEHLAVQGPTQCRRGDMV